jgi:plasmid stability protein
MRPLTVRNVDEAIVRKLRSRAERTGRNVNDEVCGILRDAVASEDRPMVELEIAHRSRRLATVRKRPKSNRPWMTSGAEFGALTALRFSNTTQCL